MLSQTTPPSGDSLARYFVTSTLNTSWWRQRYERWLKRRIPAARSVTLDQRRIFIFPSRIGLFFLVVLAVMLIAAINYQNNMAFALVFFLFSLFIIAILHTFSNLSGLCIEAMHGYPTFAGEVAEFELALAHLDVPELV